MHIDRINVHFLMPGNKVGENEMSKSPIMCHTYKTIYRKCIKNPL